MRGTLRLLMIFAVGLMMWAAFSSSSGEAQGSSDPSEQATASAVVESTENRPSLIWSMARWPLAALSAAAVLFVTAIQLGVLFDYRAGRISMRDTRSEERALADTAPAGALSHPGIPLAPLDTAPMKSIGD